MKEFTMLYMGVTAARALLGQVLPDDDFLMSLLRVIVELGSAGLLAAVFYLMWQRERARADAATHRERKILYRLAGLRYPAEDDDDTWPSVPPAQRPRPPAPPPSAGVGQ